MHVTEHRTAVVVTCPVHGRYAATPGSEYIAIHEAAHAGCAQTAATAETQPGRRHRPKSRRTP